MKPMISTDKDLFSSSKVRALQNATDTIWITPRIYETICDMFCLTWPSHAWSCRCASRHWGWRGLWLAPVGVCELTTEQTHETYVDAHQLLFIPEKSSYLMKTSMMDLHTSTLTPSFWNMSRNGKKRSWRTNIERDDTVAYRDVQPRVQTNSLLAVHVCNVVLD